MKIKKTGGVIFGAELNAAEKKALDVEIKRQLVEYNHKNLREIDAIVLWALHSRLGFGEKRLKEFYDGFAQDVLALSRRYELSDDDNAWLFTKKLKDDGIDIEKW